MMGDVISKNLNIIIFFMMGFSYLSAKSHILVIYNY